MTTCAWVVIEKRGFLSDGSRYRPCGIRTKGTEFCVKHERQADKRRLLGWKVNPWSSSSKGHPDQDTAICANCEVPVDASKTPDSSMLHLCPSCSAGRGA